MLAGPPAGGTRPGVVMVKIALIAKIAPVPLTLRALSTPREPTFSSTTQGIRTAAQSVLKAGRSPCRPYLVRFSGSERGTSARKIVSLLSVCGPSTIQ